MITAIVVVVVMFITLRLMEAIKRWFTAFVFPGPIDSPVLLSPLLHLPLILVSPLRPLRSTCIFAAIAAQMNSATLFGSSSLCPFTPLTHGSVSCSSPMTSTMFTLAQCGTAMKVRSGEIKNGGDGKPLP